jgi:hypothetical protein
MTPSKRHAPASPRGSCRAHDEAPPLRAVLLSAGRLRRVWLEAACFDLDVEAEFLKPVWDRAIAAGLLTPVGTDPATGQTVYTLSPEGRQTLRRPAR